MRFNLNQDLSEKKGVISNLHGFLNRYLDTGFKTKWTGFWAPPFKFLDYYAVKVNGVWLNSSTVEGVEYGDKMVFYHEAGGTTVKETAEMPDSLPGLRLTFKVTNNSSNKKAVRTSIKPAVDIRKKSKDIPEIDYDLEIKDKRLTVSNAGKKLMISTNEKMNVEGKQKIDTHYPEEKQKAFIPGKIVLEEEIEGEESEEFLLEFTTSDASFGSINKREEILEHQNLGQAFQEGNHSLINLIYDRKGEGILAGHPWFQNYWSRDTFWSVLGLIDLGYFELATSILENFAEKKGFPNMISLEENKSYPNADAAPLFVIAADKLKRHWKITEKIQKKQEEALDTLKIENGVVNHDPEGTWMDTLKRAPAVEIQSLWLEAAKIMEDERVEKLKSGLRSFEEEKYVKDHLSEDAPQSINPAVPLMFGHFEDSKAYSYLEKINGEFCSRYGARTRALTDIGYQADGYHTGSVWGLTTAWAAAANLNYGKTTHGRNYLEKMTQFQNRNQVGGFPEVVNAETGELMGCSEQAWSAALFNHVIDSYLLGINVKDSHIEVNPKDNLTAKRLNKRINDERIDLKVENGDVEILNSPEIELIVW